MAEHDLGTGTRWVRGVLWGAAAVLAARTSESVAIRRWARNPPPFNSIEFEMPGVTHHLPTSDGGTVHAIVDGEGPTVILGHGIAGHHGHWAPVARQLIERDFRVIVFDKRGHGNSVPGSAGFELEGLAHDLAAVLGALGGDDPVVLGGHSMGGIGIQALLRHRPELFEQVRGVVLVATTSRSVENPMTKLLRSTPGFRAYRRLLEHETQARVLMRSGFGVRPSIELIDHLRRSWDQCPDATLRGHGDGLRGFDFTTDLRRLASRTIVVCGDRDQVTPLAMSHELLEHLPDAELEVAVGAGHMVIWERPDLITDSLARLATSSPP